MRQCSQRGQAEEESQATDQRPDQGLFVAIGEIMTEPQVVRIACSREQVVASLAHAIGSRLTARLRESEAPEAREVRIAIALMPDDEWNQILLDLAEGLL